MEIPVEAYWEEVKLDGVPTIKVQCPGCKTWGFLDGHTILSDGSIQPSVDCTECDFHEMVKLKAWKE
jgi:hypothetical protein